MVKGNGEPKDSTTPPEPWPAITQGERTLYEILFYSQGPVDGYILGEGVRELLLKSGLSLTVLSQIWNLADVSNDNVLNVHEFSLVMHLVRGRMAGLVVPQTLPRVLTPPKVQPLAPPPMSQQEKDAYLRVFQALDVKRTGFIDGSVATALLRSSGLSDDVITSIWDVADFGRDGRLNPEELAIAGHLVRHAKAGGSLDGPVNIFQYAPQHVSPISLLARKRRVAEYQEHKQRLMSLKETRKQQSTREAKRLELVKNKIKCLEELAILLRKLGKADSVDEAQLDQVLNQDKEETRKQEEIVFRLKKEHEKVRQETVKIILGEHVFNEDIRIIKAETDELNKRLLTSHSHATKDPDPFHQLYEQRKEKRQGSTIKDLDKIDIHIPFEFSPFDLNVTPDTLPAGARILKASNAACDSEVLSVIAGVKGFGEEFMQDWGGSTTATSTPSSTTPAGTMSSPATVLPSGSDGKEFDDDEIFVEVEEAHDPWPILDGSNDCLLGLTDDQVVSLKAKLDDLRNELKQLNTGHRKLIFRNQEDYSSRQRAKEAEEVSDRGRFNRRSAAERIRNTSTGSSISRTSREGSGSGVRHRVTSDKSASDAAQAVRDYRLKRRSQNLDSGSSSPDSIRRTNVLNQDGGPNSSHRRHLSSSVGSPSVSDEASLSRQSSLSSTDRPVANNALSSPANGTQQLRSTSPKSDKIVEENIQASSKCVVNAAPPPLAANTTVPTQTSPATSDSSILKIKSNRRKDELSLALGSAALGRTIHVEPAHPSVSKSTGSKSRSTRTSEKSRNLDPLITPSTIASNTGNSTKDEHKSVSSSETKPTAVENTGSETVPKVSSRKKSRAPLPPPSPAAVEATQSSTAHPLNNHKATHNSTKTQPPVASNTSSSVTVVNSAKPPAPEPVNQSNLINSPSDIPPPSKLNRNLDNANKSEDHPDPKRPPRIKRASISERRNSGSDCSSLSSACADSLDRGPTSPTFKTDPSVPLSPRPTQETMSSTSVKMVNTTPKLQAPSKKRPAPSPTVQQINEANALRSPTSTKTIDDSSNSNATSSNSVIESSHKHNNVPPLNLSSLQDSRTSTSSIDDNSSSSAAVDREENDSPPPPPLPASPPPLPSSPPPLPTLNAPSLMQEDSSIEEEMVTVEYSSSVNFSAVALSPPSMRAKKHEGIANSSSEDIGLGNDLHLNINGITGNDEARDVDSSNNDSDMTDTDGEDQNGKYEIFSPGDSGIMTTSSIATTPDESDSNIELVNYTPYSNNDIITNNNYMTTNFNFVNRNNAPDDNPVVTTAAAEAPLVNGAASASSISSPSASSSSLTQSVIIPSVSNKEPVSEMSIQPSKSNRISSSPNALPQSPTAADEDIIVPSVKQLPQQTPVVLFESTSASSTAPKSYSDKTENNSKGITSDRSYRSNNGYKTNDKDIDLNNYEEDDSSFQSSLPNWSDKGGEEKVMSPRNQDIMAKARHFADMVQPKKVIILKSEMISKTTNEARGLSKDPSAKDVGLLLHQKTSLEDVAKQRQNILSQATNRRKTDNGAAAGGDGEAEDDEELRSKKSNPSDYGYTYLTPREQPAPEVGWKDKEAEDSAGVINLYSQNVVKEGDTTDSVDRESIANLNTTKQQWETIFNSNLNSPDEETNLAAKKKSAPKWEVKIPASYNKSGGSSSSVKSDNRGNSSSSSYSDGSGVDCVDSSKVDMEVMNKNNNNNTSHDSSNASQYEGESAIEYEIRMAREREEMLMKEKEERARLIAMQASSPPPPQQQSVASPVQKSSGPMAVLSSMEAVNGESESYQPAYNELVEADRGPGVWSMGPAGRSQERYETKAVADAHESIIEREIRLQQEKEAELERQRMMLSQTLSPTSSSPPTPPLQPEQQQQQYQEPPVRYDHRPEALHSPPSERMSPIIPSSARQNQAPPSQESIIAKELRESQEREEEMRHLRSIVHGVDLQKTENESTSEEQQPHPSNPTSLSVTSIASNYNGQNRSPLSPPSSQTTPNSQGTWQREVSPFVSQHRRVSQDSGSSHSHSISKASSDTVPSRSVSVQPISDGHEGSDDDDKPNYFKKQETPIEREMRIAKERENELRRMKGMPELSNKDDYYYGEQPDKSGKVEHSRPITNKAPTRQSLNKVSNTRLQQEMSAQKEREKNEGKVISDSGESIKTNRYREVTGTQSADGSEKRNFVTKRSSTHIAPQASELQQKQQPSNNTSSQQAQASTGAASLGGSSKSLGGGSKNFSYKEFRQTAESKIERELREMREREEELRNQRRVSTTQTPR